MVHSNAMPQKLGFNCDEKLEFTLENITSDFHNTVKLILFAFKGENIIHACCLKDGAYYCYCIYVLRISRYSYRDIFCAV